MCFDDSGRRDAPSSLDFMASSPFAHIAYTLDLTVIDLNWRHARLTGVPRDAAVGRKLFDVFPPNPDLPEVDVRPAVAASLDRMVSSREPDTMDVFQHDLVIAPGARFVERYWQITHSPIFEGPEDSGKIVGALQTTRDVTQETIRRKITAAKQRAATMGGQLSFFELDFETDEVDVSQGFEVLHGYVPGEAGPHLSHYYSRVHEEDRDRTITLIEALRDAPGRTEESNQYRALWPDGTVRWLSARMEVVRGSGEHGKLTGIVLDVTDLHRKEEELRAAIAARDLLLAEVNHRVKNSLQLVTSILNMEATQAARAGEAGVDRLRDAAARVRTIAAVHATLYQGDDVRSVDLASFIGTLCQHLAEASGAEDRGIALKVVAEDIRVETDRAIPLALIANEVVTNAFKHAFPDGRRGTVRVTLRRSGPDRLVLEIEDDGTGGDPSASQRGPATDGGFGRRLVETLGHQLRAEMRSVHDSTGTRVHLNLPV